MDYQWYPGHMTKARRAMEEDIRLVDLVIELLDARIPFSSRNPDIDAMASGKSRIVLLNKADLADERVTKKWQEWFEEKGILTLTCNARSGAGLRAIPGMAAHACAEKIAKDQQRGIKKRAIKAMIAGIPNVGKSTLINSLAGRTAAKTGNKPGVTRGKQWIAMGKDMNLLDTPGILWPKFEDKSVGMHLALIGSIREEILDTGEMSIALISFLKEQYPGILNGRYAVDESQETLKILKQIADVRGLLQKGAQPDLGRAAALMLDDFRSGRLGRISLETPSA